MVVFAISVIAVALFFFAVSVIVIMIAGRENDSGDLLVCILASGSIHSAAASMIIALAQ